MDFKLKPLAFVHDEAVVNAIPLAPREPQPEEFWITKTCADYAGDEVEPRPVQLVKEIWAPLGRSGKWWLARCVKDDYTFALAQKNLDRRLEDMEVIAWAAS